MQKVKSNFIGKFKIGDNVVHNLKILEILYRSFNNLDVDERTILHKPITLILVSISEAIIYDLFFRVKHFTSEGVSNISDKTLQKIREKKFRKFKDQIVCVEKYSIYGPAQKTSLYTDLHYLRDLRNRIHIQNEEAKFEPDEEMAFTESRMRKGEKAAELIFKISEMRYPRLKGRQFVSEFNLPWPQHFNETEIRNILGIEAWE